MEPFNATAAYGLAMALTRGGDRQTRRQSDGPLSAPSRQLGRDHLFDHLSGARALRRSNGVHRPRARTDRHAVSRRSCLPTDTSSVLAADPSRGSRRLARRRRRRRRRRLVAGIRATACIFFATTRVDSLRQPASRRAPRGPRSSADYDNDGATGSSCPHRGGDCACITGSRPGASEMSVCRVAARRVAGCSCSRVRRCRPRRRPRRDGRRVACCVTAERAAFRMSALTRGLQPGSCGHGNRAGRRRQSPRRRSPRRQARGPSGYSSAISAMEHSATSRRRSACRRPGPYTAVAVADINKDTIPDFFFGRADAAGVFAMSQRRRQIHGRSDAPAASDWRECRAVRRLRQRRPARSPRADSRGCSLVEVCRQPVGRCHVVGRCRGAQSPRPIPRRRSPLRTWMRTATRTPSCAVASGAVRVWRNDGGNHHPSVRVRLTARVSNRDAVGAKVELRAGSLRHKIETIATTPGGCPG